MVASRLNSSLKTNAKSTPETVTRVRETARIVPVGEDHHQELGVTCQKTAK